MKTNMNSSLTNWKKLLASLPWTPKHAERSAKLALSKAQWLGLDKEQAIQQVFDMALGGFFEANPHLPVQTWQAVSEEMCQADETQLGVADPLTSQASMNNFPDLDTTMQMELQRNTIQCSFDLASVATCIPVRTKEQVNGRSPQPANRKRGVAKIWY